MEEYIRLEKEKVRRRGKVYNWETAKYGKIWYDEDVHDLRSVETEFPVIDFNDELSSENNLLIYGREIHRVYVFDFRGLTELVDEGLSGRMLMEHKDAKGQGVFTS
nr:hypothetical protein [Tanacetum cinerariifolium]